MALRFFMHGGFAVAEQASQRHQGLRCRVFPTYSGFAFIGSGACCAAVVCGAKRISHRGDFTGEQSLFNFWLAVNAASLYHGGCMFVIQTRYKKNARCVSGEILPRSPALGLVGSRPGGSAGQTELAGACSAAAAAAGCTPVTNVASSHYLLKPAWRMGWSRVLSPHRENVVSAAEQLPSSVAQRRGAIRGDVQ